MTSMVSGGSSLRGATGSNSSLKGTGYKQVQTPKFSPEQMQLFQQLFSHVSPDSYLSKLASGDEGIFNQIEAPALRQFGQLQGNIASRFSGMGSGARRSSGFQNTLSGAAGDLAERLAGNRQSLQQQAIKDLFGLSGQLLEQRPYKNALIPEEQQEPWWSKAASFGLPAVGGVLGGIFGGPMGAVAGASGGNSIASTLRGKKGNAIDWQGISSLPRQWSS